MRSDRRLAVGAMFFVAGVVGCGESEVTRLTRELQTAKPAARERAATALGRQAPGDRRVSETLATALDDADPAVRLAAATSLLRIDPGSEAPRAVMLEAVREGHAPVLSVIGESRPEWAVGALIEQLDNRHPHIRALSARALGEIGIGSEAVLAALRRRHSDQVPAVRDAAAAAIDAISAGDRQSGSQRSPR